MTTVVHALIEKGDMLLLIEDGIDVLIPHGPVGQGETPEEALVKIIRDTAGLRVVPYRLAATEISEDLRLEFWRCVYMGGLPEVSRGIASWYSRQEAAGHLTARHPLLEGQLGP